MLQKLKTPILLICLFLLLILIWKVLKLPSDEVLIEMVKGYFLTYGLITVLLASIIEGMLLVGVYLPGGMVIFLGVITASGNPRQAFLSVLMTIIGLSIAYTINYFLGKYGWYKVLMRFGLSSSLQKAENDFNKYGYKAIFMSYWQPNFAALTSTGAGISNANFKKFFIYSSIATILWSAFWGTLAYFLGQKILDYLGPVFLIVMLGWIGIIIHKHYRGKYQNSHF